MIKKPAMVASLFFAASQLSAQLSVAPIAHDVAPVKIVTTVDKSSDAVATELKAVAKDLGAKVGKSSRGNAVLVLRNPAIKLDEYCLYPVINAKTGGHLHTFASWQMELLHGSSTDIASRPSGDVLLEVAISPIDNQHARVEFWSNCLADTEMGRVLANSKGKFETAVISKIAPRTNLSAWLSANGASIDVPAEVPYKPRKEIDFADIHGDPLRSLHPGLSDKTLVSLETAISAEESWKRAKVVAENFSKKSGLAITKIDEAMRQIRIGDSEVLSAHDWRDDYTLSIADLGSTRSRVSVVRRLLVRTSNATWRAYASDGEVESWIVGAVRDAAVGTR